jgi:hypothetical protein
MKLGFFLAVSFLTCPSFLIAGSVDESFRIVCHSTSEGLDSVIDADEHLTITRRPTYGASLEFNFNIYQAKLTVDFEDRPDNDRWAVSFINTATAETFSEVSSKIGAATNEISMKVKTPDQTKQINLNCKISRL